MEEGEGKREKSKVRSWICQNEEDADPFREGVYGA